MLEHAVRVQWLPTTDFQIRTCVYKKPCVLCFGVFPQFGVFRHPDLPLCAPFMLMPNLPDVWMPLPRHLDFIFQHTTSRHCKTLLLYVVSMLLSQDNIRKPNAFHYLYTRDGVGFDPHHSVILCKTLLTRLAFFYSKATLGNLMLSIAQGGWWAWDMRVDPHHLQDIAFSFSTLSQDTIVEFNTPYCTWSTPFNYSFLSTSVALDLSFSIFHCPCSIHHFIFEGIDWNIVFHQMRCDFHGELLAPLTLKVADLWGVNPRTRQCLVELVVCACALACSGRVCSDMAPFYSSLYAHLSWKEEKSRKYHLSGNPVGGPSTLGFSGKISPPSNHTLILDWYSRKRFLAETRSFWLCAHTNFWSSMRNHPCT